MGLKEILLLAFLIAKITKLAIKTGVVRKIMSLMGKLLSKEGRKKDYKLSRM